MLGCRGCSRAALPEAYLQHGPRAVEHGASSWAEVLGRRAPDPVRPSELQGIGPWGRGWGTEVGRVLFTLVELGCRACSWYTVRQSLLRLIYTLTSRSEGRAGANIRCGAGKEAGRMSAGQTQAPKNHLGGSQPPSYGLGLPDSPGASGNFLLHRAWEPLTQTRGDIFGGHRMKPRTLSQKTVHRHRQNSD